MRIMHIAWEYPPLVYGGLGRHVHALTVAQAAAGHEVTVVTQQHPDAPTDSIVDGVRVVRHAPTPDIVFEPQHLIAWVTTLDDALATSACALVPELLPEMVHCHDWMTTHAGVTAAAAADAPLVATIHATERGRHQGYLPNDISATVDSVERHLSNEATWVIACSRAMRAEVQRQFDVPADKISVIPNGIDTRHWRTTPAEKEAARHRWAPHGPLLVFSGRLEAEKGIFTLIDAMPAILASRPDTQLIVAGQGGQSARFDEVVAERNLGDHVRRTGWLPEADLKAMIAASDAAIIPSLYEPFGLVALEAMSLGAPVMCARTGGLADIVTDGQTGLLFRPGDPADLARAALAILDDPAAAAHRATLATASLRVQFDWRVIARDTVAVYEYLTSVA